jgi:N-acetyl-anhydromuramyl-L-alanine amidase AmpD
MSIFFLLLYSAIIAQENTNIKIIEKPIIYSKEREKLSVAYLKERHGIIQENATIVPKIIVLHYTAGGSINSNFNYFNSVEIENSRKLNKDQSKLNVSAHYLIDRDGTIYHLVPDTLFARHTIGLNYCAIGIENIGSKESPLTNQQVLANSNLIRYLSKKHQIEYVIGHSEYIKFRKSNLWKETNSNYITYKSDPGDQFLIDVRKLITDLNFKYQP